jgi:hypothetical protein
VFDYIVLIDFKNKPLMLNILMEDRKSTARGCFTGMGIDCLLKPEGGWIKS